MKAARLRSSVRILLIALAFLCISLASSQLFFRLDMTDDKVYTLSEGSLKIAEKLEEDVTVKLYVSKSFEDLPPAFKSHGRRVEEVLREYASHAKGHLKIELIDPQPDTDDEVWARKYGVRGFPSPSGENAYLGLVLLSGDKEHALPFLDPRKEDLLEFEISEALIKLQRGSQVKLGIFSPTYIGTTESQAVDSQGRRTERAFLSRLKEFYQVEVFQNPPDSIPEDIKVLLVYHPKDATPKFQYALDQYVMRGGRLIVIVDSFSRTELDAQQSPENPLAQIPKLSSQLPTLFDHWGLRFHDDQIVGDAKRATRVDMGTFTFDYPFYLTLEESDFSSSHIITASLKQIQLAESGWFELIEGKSSLSFEPLLHTSDQGAVGPTNLDGLRDHQTAEQGLSADRKVRNLAGLLKGHFTSAFTAPPADSENKLPFVKEGTADNTVLLVGDADFIHESQALEFFDYGGQTAQRPRNDNINFLTNSLAYMGGADELISIRSSGRVQRPFLKVRELQLKAQEKWKAEEDKFASQLRTLQSRISELKKVPAEGEEVVTTPEQEAEFKKYKEEELRVRGLLREVRKNLREDIESLGRRLTALNILLVPGLVSACGVLVFWRRERRAR